MAHTISLKTFNDFLDVKQPETLFFIPAYQRGYRWQPKQVKELLDDLYSFACKKKEDGEFYCLQPLIVKKVTNLDSVPESLACISKEIDIWEVIDGQQRLTTLRILYRYLMLKRGYRDNASLQENKNRCLFHIFYESRTEDFDYIENISMEAPDKDHTNIDTDHIFSAISEIDRWIKEDAPIWSERFGKDDDPEAIRELLFKLLNTSGKAVAESCGRVKFLWYELEPDSTQAVKEFLDVNNGKIPLTDSELIKALFLKKVNSSNQANQSSQEIKALVDESLRQDRWAKTWEKMENRLNDNGFWSFLSKDILAEDRMKILFDAIYRRHHDGNIPEKGDIFRHYYALISDSTESKTNQKLKENWEELISEYRLLEDWQNDAIIYNLIGLLMNFGYTLYDIRKIYDEGGQYDTFVKNLKSNLASHLTSKINQSDKTIKAGYSKKKEVREILLFINVIGMVSELETIRLPLNVKANSPEEEEMLKSRPKLSPPAYKFPFDLMLLQNWDVEHIDSATTNKLKSKEDLAKWILLTFEELSGFPAGLFAEGHKLYDVKDEETLKDLLSGMSQDELNNIKEIIRMRFESEDNNDDLKDTIGNLTLLDYQTNREYGNAIYPVKRKKIFQAIKGGRYVPLMTRLAFSKAFSPDSNLKKWTSNDKRGYHDYIYNIIENFIKSNSNG